nr:isoprenylcysteine carboxylmethyltransferase family protein [Galbitalea soli]
MARPVQRRGTPTPAFLTDAVLQLTLAVALAGPLLLAIIVPRQATVGCLVSGSFLVLAGSALRAWAMVVLGQRFQLTPVEQPDVPTLIVRGPYGVVRHPGYVALLAQFAGLALILSDPLALLFCAPTIAGTVIRIRAEEQLLTREFGPTHETYRQSVRWKLVPWIY